MIGIPHECPRCSSPSLRLSHSARNRRVARLIFLQPLRCLECHSIIWRFSTFAPHHDPTPQGAKHPDALILDRALENPA